MPYKSDAQRRKFHAMENRGEISHKVVAEFDRASKGKPLPEHVHKKSHHSFPTTVSTHAPTYKENCMEPRS